MGLKRQMPGRGPVLIESLESRTLLSAGPLLLTPAGGAINVSDATVHHRSLGVISKPVGPQLPGAADNGLVVRMKLSHIPGTASPGATVGGGIVALGNPTLQPINGDVSITIYAWTPANGANLGVALATQTATVSIQSGNATGIKVSPFQLPNSVGSYYLLAGATFGSLTGHTAALAKPVNVGRLVDLSVSAASATINGGNSVATFTITNNGNVAVKGNGHVGLWPSTNASFTGIDNSSLIAASKMVVNLQPGESDSYNWNFIPLASQPAADPFLMIEIFYPHQNLGLSDNVAQAAGPTG